MHTHQLQQQHPVPYVCYSSDSLPQQPTVYMPLQASSLKAWGDQADLMAAAQAAPLFVTFLQ
jgi:hypothetical protein